MTRTALFPALISVVFLPAAALADPSLECSLGNGSQVEIGNCVAKTEASVNATIDVALGFARASAEELDATTGRAGAVPALDAAQTAWAAYRDAQCEYVGSTFGGGSGTGIAIQSCRIELGRERVAELMKLVQ